MTVRITADHNLEAHHMVPALLALALADGVDEPLEKALGAARQSREPVPETWMTELIADFSQAGRALDDRMVANTHKMILGFLYEQPEKIIKAFKPSQLSWSPGRKRPTNLMMTQGQIDELAALIRAHYRVMIRAGNAPAWAIDAAAERRWKALGVLRPEVNFSGMVGDAFVGGRLAQILDDGASLADMRRMAREFPLSREAALTMQAVQDRMSFDLAGGVGYRAEQQAGRLVQGRNAESVRQIVAAYRSGELKRTPTNRQGFSPQEMESLGGDTTVAGWRGLGRELRNRMAGEDRNRDWDRVAASSLRMSANIGAIDAMAEEGVTELWYDVHPSACNYCKELYLEADGTPRIFTVAEIVENITATGGANYDRKASQIGDKEAGWVANSLAHPWCQCRPKRKIKNVTPKGRIEY